MKPYISLILILLTIASCQTQQKAGKESITISKAWIDSIIQKSDTSWTKPYRNNTFVTAAYYVNRKDSNVTQLFKDSLGNIRQVIIAKYDQIRLFFGEYNANGQLMNAYTMDSLGKFNGFTKQYFESGIVKSSGNYVHGFRNGKWNNYDDAGKLISIDIYDNNGQLIKQEKQ